MARFALSPVDDLRIPESKMGGFFAPSPIVSAVAAVAEDEIRQVGWANRVLQPLYLHARLDLGTVLGPTGEEGGGEAVARNDRAG